MLSGFGFLEGMGDLPRDVEELIEVCELLRSGTVEPARRDGFLCVISDLSTFRRPEVIVEPWFSWSNTADMSPPLDTPFGPGGGGGGGGGVGASSFSNLGSGGGGGGDRALFPDEGATPD